MSREPGARALSARRCRLWETADEDVSFFAVRGPSYTPRRGLRWHSEGPVGARATSTFVGDVVNNCSMRVRMNNFTASDLICVRAAFVERAEELTIVR